NGAHGGEGSHGRGAQRERKGAARSYDTAEDPTKHVNHLSVRRQCPAQRRDRLGNDRLLSRPSFFGVGVRSTENGSTRRNVMGFGINPSVLITTTAASCT